MLKIIVVFNIIFINFIFAEATEHPYCFRFTWLGAYQDKNNILGLTCEHLREDLTYIPCRRPLVATDNDQPPDMVDLWHKHQNGSMNAYGCPMVPGQSCVKYTYIYNKAIQNITYMCAKVNATNGCYYQKYITGLEVEVCVCSSTSGLMPCNVATQIQQQYIKFFSTMCIIIALSRLSNLI